MGVGVCYLENTQPCPGPAADFCRPSLKGKSPGLPDRQYCLRVAGGLLCHTESCSNDQTSHCRFSICGQISIVRSPDTVKQMSKYKVVLSSQDKDKSLVTVETDAHGSFCFKAKPGTYKVQVHELCLS